MLKINKNIKIKRGCSDIKTIHTQYDYKTYGTQFICHPLDLCRPHAANLFNIEILVNMHMYFQISVEPFAKGTICYDIQHFLNSRQKFGGSAKEMEKDLLAIYAYLILGPDSLTAEIKAWRNATPFGKFKPVIMEFKHYKNNWCWPNPPGKSISDIIDQLLTVGAKESFVWCPNSSWKKKARAVVGKYFGFYPGDEENRYFTYYINYSMANREPSSWNVKINSDPDETFIDFVLRLHSIDFLSQEGKLHLQKRKDSWNGYNLNAQRTEL